MMDPKGETYSAENGHHIVWAQELLDDVDFESEWRQIVDLGCGSGEVTRLLAQKLPEAQILAVDKFPSMIHQARASNPLPGVDYQILDLEEPLQAAYQDRADFVSAIHVLHWIKDLETALGNIRAILKPGGHFFLVHVLELPRMDDLKSAIATIGAKHPELDAKWYEDLCARREWKTSPSEDYRRICEKLGLEVTTETRRMDYWMDEGRLNPDLISVMFPVLETLHDDVRAQVVDSVLNLFKSKCRDGKFHWYIDDLVIRGEKKK